MAVRDILKMGNPKLFEVSESVQESELSELNQLVKDMIETMIAANGAGLAAPQIGVLKRVVIFGVDFNPRYPDAEPVPFTVLINPNIEVLNEEKEYGWEGCLSVPGMRGLVPRHTKIRYTGLDLAGNPIDRTVSDFHARVVQHECDHIDGILYPMRIENMKHFGFEDELMNFPSRCEPSEQAQLALVE